MDDAINAALDKEDTVLDELENDEGLPRKRVAQQIATGNAVL